MKKIVVSTFLVAAAMAFQSCNTSETHERGVDHPAGETQGPASGEEARDKAGDDANDQGKETADEHGGQGN